MGNYEAEAAVTAYGRSAIGKSPKGTLKDTRPEAYAAQVIKGIPAKVLTLLSRIRPGNQ